MYFYAIFLLWIHPGFSKTYFTPGNECENAIVRSINKTVYTLDIAIYSITNDRIIDAIIEAHNRGVIVRILTDAAQSKAKNSKAQYLQSRGINIKINSKYKIEHNKFSIFDKKEVETGSYNYTLNATKRNSENCHFLKQKIDIRKYQARFNFLWRQNSAIRSEIKLKAVSEL